MRFNSSFIIIPLITIIVALIGKVIAGACQATSWYSTLNLPKFTPATWFFPIIWHLIFTLTAIAAIIVWNKFEKTINFWAIISLFVTNALLNVLWTFLFFDQHQIAMALADAVALVASTIALMVLIGQQSRFTAILLLPYVLWGAFAIYLNSVIWMTN